MRFILLASILLTSAAFAEVCNRSDFNFHSYKPDTSRGSSTIVTGWQGDQSCIHLKHIDINSVFMLS